VYIAHQLGGSPKTALVRTSHHSEVSDVATIDLVTLEASAASKLDPATYAYIASGAGDSATVNAAAWNGVRLRPRMLRDVTETSTGSTVLGHRTSTPIMIAPTAMHRLVLEEGELATARAAARTGVTYVVSMAATTSIAEIARAAPAGRRWMQAYLRRDRGITRACLERAAAAGCEAVVLTVDAPGKPTYRALPGPRLNRDLPLPNLAPGESHPDVLALAADYAANVTFDDLAEIRGWTDLPLVVKGILRGDDAVRCLGSGADAVAVSNHGGRQIPGCAAPAEVLPEVVNAVDGRGDVYVDGGIRGGADVLKALALGATAVMVGRPVLWGLAVGGEDGAAAVLEQLTADLTRMMALCGIPDISDVSADLVVAA
jgi:4-hydroxymandelate oxidase